MTAYQYILENPVEQVACRLAWDLLGIQGSKLKILGDTAFPDRLFWLPGGKPFLIEFKRPGLPPEPKQQDNHAWLRKLGYDVEVHDDPHQALNSIIRRVLAVKITKAQKLVAHAALEHCYVLMGKTSIRSKNVPTRKKAAKRARHRS